MKGGRGALVLEDGRTFYGWLFGGGELPRFGEVVFTTGMAGYQEVVTDPSYAGQIVTMAYPLIGNTGVNETDAESRRPWVAGLVVREIQEEPSHWQERETLAAHLASHGVPGLSGVDTRALVRHIREHGTLRGVIVPAPEGPAAAEAWAEKARAWRMGDVVGEATCEAEYEVPAEEPWEAGPDADGPKPGGGRPPRVVVVDFGAKGNIVRELVRRGCRVRVVPARTPPEAILAWRPDGVVLSNGPGDPADEREGVACVRGLIGRVPIFGICLGHQLLALALGGRTAKLKFGHRGVNHPVRDERTGEVLITTHNHGYAVVEESLPPELRVTHRHLHDGTVEGMEHRDLPIWSVQFHPEASPGPGEAKSLFDAFLARVRAGRREGEA
ncbi:MAG: glutamine-hydrolyzing carbamoyl-phosphate synthase small subunit [Clostridia bacterium]|nr:glutamine-hydrolyzing carbamoyl-phosphate synthase small subunit [Clostridia bacterium]